MDIAKTYAVFFSATFSTRKIVAGMADELGYDRVEYDITGRSPDGEVRLSTDDLLLIGVPVYGGRVPVDALKGIASFKGDNTPAILVCVYGNREYDDAMIELNDLVRANGFVPVAAAAVIAEHCIFPKVAAGRPDDADWQKIEGFCREVKTMLRSRNDFAGAELPIDGHRPYKALGSIPIHPSAGKDCNGCGICAGACPVGAISSEDPRKTDTAKCIACVRCINVCPTHSRKFRGLLYRIAARKFVKNNSARKEPLFIHL